MKQTTMALIGLICVVCAATMMSGCLGTYDASDASGSKYESNHLTILETSTEVGSISDMYVMGTIRNDGKDIFYGADIKTTIYDKNGNVIREGNGIAFQMYPGETSTFRTMLGGQLYRDTAASYEIAIIHQNWGELTREETMKMVTTASGNVDQPWS